MAATLVGGLGIGYLTRRSSKDLNATTKEANAAELYSGFSASQTAFIASLLARVEAVEHEREESKRLNREHMKWDWVLIRAIRIALPDEEFPDPPPLDT